MTLYCLIQDARIVGGPRPLPAKWYGWELATLSAAELAAKGWLPSNALPGVRCHSPHVYPDRVGYVIDLPPLRARKERELLRAYDAEQSAELISSALGEPHAYTTTGDARVDLLGSGLLGRAISYSCTRLADGVKASYLHTPEQIAQVLAEAATWREGLIAKLNRKRVEIADATDAATIAAIVWQEG